MSKGLRNYEGEYLKHVVDRRLKQGGNGLGVLAAKDYKFKKDAQAMRKSAKAVTAPLPEAAA